MPDYRAILEGLLAPIEGDWLAALTESYENRARFDLKRWLDYLSKPEPETDRFDREDKLRSPGGTYATLTSSLTEAGWRYRRVDAYYLKSEEGLTDRRALVRTKPGASYAKERRNAAVEDFVADLESARFDAKRRFDEARELFLGRNTDKLTAATFGLDEPEIEGSFVWTGNVEGSLRVTFPNGDLLRTRTYIKHNWSKLGNPYLQYPTTFWITRAGCEEETTGLDWLVENFSVTPRKAIPETAGADPKKLIAASRLAENLSFLARFRSLEKELTGKQDTREGRYGLRTLYANEKAARTAVTKARNLLDLPEDVTLEEATGLLARSLDGERLARLKAAVAGTAEEPARGKKGKALRDLDKELEKLGLVFRNGTRGSRWGGELLALLGA